MASYFKLYNNSFCSTVPTEVQALSSGITEGWSVTTGNSIGTTCVGYTPVPTPAPTWTPTILW